MAKQNGASKTEVKYEITSCCYCNEFLDNDNFKSHIAECGQVLQKCPYGCTAYIRRKDIVTHKAECRQRRNHDVRTYSEPSGFVESDFIAMKNSLTAMRTSLHDEVEQSHRIIADLTEIRRQGQQLDIWLECLEAAQKELQEALGEEAKTRGDEVAGVERRLDNLGIQYTEVKEWRKELRHLLDEFHRDLEFRNDVTLNMEVLFNDKERLAGRMNNIENGFERLQLLSPTGVIDNRDTCKRCAILEQKLAEAVLELRQMKNIVCESEDKCERLDRIVVENRKKCAQMKQEVSDINIHLLMEKKLRVITNFSGHLIWCIDRFAEKMVDAKENDVILKSPIFSNRQYGYNLRLNVFLDGFGTWKSRNILACIDVVSGEFDSLLQWPCKLKADIILREQSSTPNDIAKTIMVRKRDATYEPSQYIFISHKAVHSRQFLKNDSIFFEVIVHSSN